METQTWYLELTEEKGSHKFYEVTLENADLTICYGQMEDTGYSKKKTLETPDKAQAEADRLLQEKREKGYQDVVIGKRKRNVLESKYPKMEVTQIAQVFAPWRTKYRRPTWIPIVLDGDGAITDSKFSGMPYLPEDESIPVCGCCGKTLQLFLQLNLDQTPRELHGKFGEGLIQVVYCTDEDCEYDGSNELGYIWEAFSNRHFLRLINNDPNISNPAQIPEKYFPAKQIIGWENHDDFPDPYEWEEKYGINMQCDFGDVFEARVICPEFELTFSSTELNFKKHIGLAIGADKLSGYPHWVQDPRYPSCPKCQATMEFIFQIDSEQDLPYMFGDMGVALITQCPEHKDILALSWDGC